MAERTHDPTPKRLREARQKGDVPRAPLVAAAAGLLAASALVPLTLRGLLGRLSSSVASLEPVGRLDPWAVALPVLELVLPVTLVLAAVAVVASLAQGTVGLAPSRLAPDPSRLDPFGGLGNLVDLGRIWSAARGLVLTMLLSLVAYRVLSLSTALAARALGEPGAVLEIAAREGRRLATQIGAVACGLAVVDVVVGRRLWLGRLRMTRDEVLREHKEGEGDPEVKRRREELRQELLAAEAVSAVRDATVVVVNPTHIACALRYERGDDEAAPTLVTKGTGALAARILEAARAHGVPVVRDVPVARALVELEIGAEIPEVLYEAVAEVLRAAWEADGGESG